MPRNPDKIRCAVPDCRSAAEILGAAQDRSWAMRGYDRCRSHLDPDLGPRGAGAPLDNLNALRRATYAHPLPAPEFERLVDTAVHHPQDLPFQVGLAVRALQERLDDTFLTLVALRAVTARLTEHVAQRLFEIELLEALHTVPIPARDHLQATVEDVAQYVACAGPAFRVQCAHSSHTWVI